MTSLVHVGRVGGLATALGIGAAILMASPEACARPDSSTPDAGNSSASDSAPSRGSRTVGRTESVSRAEAPTKALSAVRAGRRSGTPSAAVPAAARRQPSPVAGIARAKQQSNPVALVLNGYNVIPASPMEAVSFYGPTTGGPANSGLQGNQEFDLVDPNTGAAVGSFSAHVTQNGKNRTEVFQVTEIHSGTAGTGSGDTPPVGSIISVIGQGTRVTKVYSDMPSPDAPNGFVAQHYRVSPFGTMNLPVKYHAAHLHTDFGAANMPLDLLNGFSIAPHTADTEVINTITGMPPMFTVLQGSQAYSVYDRNNVRVGNFTGLVTTTSDFGGTSTKMIVVTDTGDETDIGVGPGQIPPVGTVYNVIYLPKATLLYQSSPGGHVSTTLATKKSTVPVKIGNLDASAPPPLTTVALPGGKSFAPTGSSQIIGGNGLPPRNMITQGYQQFDVLDSAGTKIGSYDAFLTREWTGMRLHLQHEEIVVTKVTGGTPGTGVGDVPVVGTMYEIRMAGSSGFGTIDISTPSEGAMVSKRYLVTPSGYVPMPAAQDSAVNSIGVNFYDPF